MCGGINHKFVRIIPTIILEADVKHIIFVIAVITILSLACGSSQTQSQGESASSSSQQNTVTESQPAAEPASYRVGQDVKVGDIRWKIIEAKDEGQTLNSDNEFIEDKTTSGKFIRITFEIENQSKDMKSFVGLDLVDSQGREFINSSDGLMFIEQDKHCVLENLNPNIVKQCQAIYEVPTDATGLKANVGDLEMLGGDEAFIDLGL